MSINFQTFPPLGPSIGAMAQNMAPLEGLLDRFRFIFDSLGGSRNPELQEFRVLEDTEKVLQEPLGLPRRENGGEIVGWKVGSLEPLC